MIEEFRRKRELWKMSRRKKILDEPREALGRPVYIYGVNNQERFQADKQSAGI
jgi:hypothetical protein